MAEDVIAQLNAGKFIADRGTYMRLYNGEFKADKDIKTVLSKPTITCEVCAIGAVFASCVRINNKMNAINSGITVDDEDMIERLKNIFDLKELALLETFFEGRLNQDVKIKHSVIDRILIRRTKLYNIYNNKYNRAYEKVTKEGKEFNYQTFDDFLLRTIMNKIIKAKGVLKF